MQTKNGEVGRVVLSKADRESPVGRELLGFLADLSADGQVTREEMEGLRSWLEVDRGVDFPACAFLYEVVETISSDGEVSEEELDALALAIERVMPPDVRLIASLKRKEHRAARRAKRAAERAADRVAKRKKRDRAKPLHRADFIIAGAKRSAERREGCERLNPGDAVVLEREPDNVHDGNAILVLSSSDIELGYVPREDAKVMAPMLDSGASAEATVKKLLESAEGYVLPVVIATLRSDNMPSPSRPARRASPRASGAGSAPVERKGCIAVLAGALLVAMIAGALSVL